MEVYYTPPRSSTSTVGLSSSSVGSMSLALGKLLSCTGFRDRSLMPRDHTMEIHTMKMAYKSRSDAIAASASECLKA